MATKKKRPNLTPTDITCYHLTCHIAIITTFNTHHLTLQTTPLHMPHSATNPLTLKQVRLPLRNYFYKLYYIISLSYCIFHELVGRYLSTLPCWKTHFETSLVQIISISLSQLFLQHTSMTLDNCLLQVALLEWLTDQKPPSYEPRHVARRDL